MLPKRPASIDPRAASLLDWKGAQPWASKIVLGGAFALEHYLNYRDTHDCDAWWNEGTDPVERAAILEEIHELRRRAWNEVASLDLVRGTNKLFSFQISVRTTRLADYLASPFGDVAIESLEENVASKMSALVGRGAPRDFRDIYQVAHELGWSREQLWAWWGRKNPAYDAAEARTLVRTHLAGIVARRPLDKVPAPQRGETQSVRAWFLGYFLS